MRIAGMFYRVDPSSPWSNVAPGLLGTARKFCEKVAVGKASVPESLALDPQSEKSEMARSG